jgi:hypothetical protein
MPQCGEEKSQTMRVKLSVSYLLEANAVSVLLYLWYLTAMSIKGSRLALAARNRAR